MTSGLVIEVAFEAIFAGPVVTGGKGLIAFKSPPRLVCPGG